VGAVLSEQVGDDGRQHHRDQHARPVGPIPAQQEDQRRRPEAQHRRRGRYRRRRLGKRQQLGKQRAGFRAREMQTEQIPDLA